MGEFVEGFDELATLTRGIAIFGSARTQPEDPDYKAAQETGALLAAQGFRGDYGWWSRNHGGRKSRRLRGRRSLNRLQHRIAIRTKIESLTKL